MEDNLRNCKTCAVYDALLNALVAFDLSLDSKQQEDVYDHFASSRCGLKEETAQALIKALKAAASENEEPESVKND